MKDNFCITNEYSIIRKGSFTIETACVMPLILLVLMGLIYLSFFVHNRAWLTAAFGSMVKRLRHRPFTAVTGVQIPLESLCKISYI